MTEKKITICGKEVKLIYCAATEKGFEEISGKNIAVFSPTIGKDKKGELIITAPAEALTSDYITLAVAGIVAAYTKDDQEPPLDSKAILYEATSDEIRTLLETIIELRNEFYKIPAVVEEQLKKEADAADEEQTPKNAPAPTNDTVGS